MCGEVVLTNNEALISLVVTTLGRATTLARLFESLLAQEHKNFEVIVVDQNDDKRLDPLFADSQWPFPVRRLRTPGETGVLAGAATAAGNWRTARSLFFPTMTAGTHPGFSQGGCPGWPKPARTFSPAKQPAKTGEASMEDTKAPLNQSIEPMFGRPG